MITETMNVLAKVMFVIVNMMNAINIKNDE